MRATSRLVLQVSQKVSIPTFSASQSIKLSRRVFSSTFQATNLSNSTFNSKSSPQIQRYRFIPLLSYTFKPLKLKRSYTSQISNQTTPIPKHTSQKPNQTNQTNQTARMALTTDPDNLPKERQPIVISGPSGSGKSTMLKMLFEKYPGRFGFSVSREFFCPYTCSKLWLLELGFSDFWVTGRSSGSLS